MVNSQPQKGQTPYPNTSTITYPKQTVGRRVMSQSEQPKQQCSHCTRTYYSIDLLRTHEERHRILSVVCPESQGKSIEDAVNSRVESTLEWKDIATNVASGQGSRSQRHPGEVIMIVAERDKAVCSFTGSPHQKREFEPLSREGNFRAANRHFGVNRFSFSWAHSSPPSPACMEM